MTKLKPELEKLLGSRADMILSAILDLGSRAKTYEDRMDCHRLRNELLIEDAPEDP